MCMEDEMDEEDHMRKNKLKELLEDGWSIPNFYWVIPNL